ncbi:endonuclease domain-containing protein [Sphingomonas sp. J315]|uniref:endonuclease domain-containing protein n=1 Tax=Sphingomonas sp. J315 TaxID=2898433 RepID=UPI0021ADF4DD|nr:endonuclease domain-containing protein [Sphingomonas sp. J315]UUY01117.1 endonuclease domain-containing protein [Sphingomonas sp. J315]
MRLKGSEQARRNAKRLRWTMTPPEIALWLALRVNAAGLRFRKQHAAGPYVLDFYCAPARLAIEVDGEAHERGDRPERDAARDTWLAEQGVRTLRYPAAEALGDLDGVVQQIITVAVERVASNKVRRRPPPPSPSAPPPPGGGG